MHACIRTLKVGVVDGDQYYFERSTYIFYDKTRQIVDVGKYIVVWKTQPSLQLYIDIFNSNRH